MWQPIETAPKDKDVLLYCPMRGVVRGRWDDCKYSTNPKPYWTHDRERLYGVRETRNDQPTHWMHLPEAPGTQAQPAPSFADAYQGAMEEVAIWKKRALEAEELNRKFVAEINGHTHMGEPARPAPSMPAGWLRAIDEALVVTHLGVANADDSYEDAKRKLNELICWHTDVATDPAVNGGFKLVPIEPTFEMLDKGSDQSDGYVSIAQEVWAAMIAAAPEVKP